MKQMGFPFAFPISVMIGVNVPHYILHSAASLLLLQVLAISSPCAQNSTLAHDNANMIVVVNTYSDF